jgi:Aldehyde dehydrogenase family
MRSMSMPRCWRSPRAGTTAIRCGKRWPLTSRWPPITFRYFAAAARSEGSSISEIDKDLIAYHFREPLGVVGQIIPFNFPLLMAAWKLAPALAAGNCSVLKPASPTPWSLLKLMEVIGDIVPPVGHLLMGPSGRGAARKRMAPRVDPRRRHRCLLLAVRTC